MKTNLAILGWALLFLVFAFFIPLPQPITWHSGQEAALGAGVTPFGGMVQKVEICGCSENTKVTVGPPRGGTFMYQPGASRTYSFGPPTRTGIWALGLAAGKVPCVKVSGPSCSNDGNYPVMLIVGTSK